MFEKMAMEGRGKTFKLAEGVVLKQISRCEGVDEKFEGLLWSADNVFGEILSNRSLFDRLED